MNKPDTSKLSFIISMVIFGTIGIFVHYIPLSSGIIAFIRGFTGAACLLIFALVSKTEISLKNIKSNLLLLCISGAAIGFNWILLFEAYRHTTVSTATLCYYMSPVFVMLVSPFVFGERLTVKKICCVIASLIGMVCISGIAEGNIPKPYELTGILLALGAAILYASVIIMNKKFKEISAHNKTFIQLAVAAAVVLPYTLLAESFSVVDFTPICVILLLTVGIVHTGIAYLLYFGAVKNIPAQTVAILSYIDPALAIILSAIILSEPMSLVASLGAILILGSTLISEITLNKKSR